MDSKSRFIPVSELPPMDGSLRPWPCSVPVLGLYSFKVQAVVFASIEDEDKPGIVTWRTLDSESQDVTQHMIGWQPLPDPKLRGE